VKLSSRLLSVVESCVAAASTDLNGLDNFADNAFSALLHNNNNN